MIKRRKHSVWVHRTDISRSTIDRERWQIKKRKISEKQNIKKKGYDQASGRTHVNIRAAFQRWRELKERERLESDAKVALFLFDRWVTSILNMLVCHLHLSLRSSLPWLCTYVWGGDFKIRARSCWAMGVFVSNINIVWQKSLSVPLNGWIAMYPT